MHSKKMVILAIITAFALLTFVACSDRSETSENATGTVTIISDGKTYTPLENWIFGQEETGAVKDGAGKQPEEVVDELEAILCGDDFEILIDGEPRNGLSYTLYNSSFEEEYYREADFSAPQDEGMYILSVEASWGNEKAYNGYQYWFKLEVAPTTSQADTTPQSSSLSSSESENAIREVNATTELIGNPDRVILMVNEVETVYEADSAEYQKTLEILNERMPDGFGEAASAFMWLDEDEDAINWSLMAQDFDYVRLAYNNPQTVKINCMKKSYEDYAPEGRFQDITFPLTESNLSGSTELFILGMKFFGILDNSEGTMSKLLP